MVQFIITNKGIKKRHIPKKRVEFTVMNNALNYIWSIVVIEIFDINIYSIIQYKIL